MNNSKRIRLIMTLFLWSAFWISAHADDDTIERSMEEQAAQQTEGKRPISSNHFGKETAGWDLKEEEQLKRKLAELMAVPLGCHERFHGEIARQMQDEIVERLQSYISGLEKFISDPVCSVSDFGAHVGSDAGQHPSTSKVDEE